MDTQTETPTPRTKLLKAVFRTPVVISALVVLMTIVMILPINPTLKMGFAGSLLFLIIYSVACIIQAKLAGLIMDSSGLAPNQESSIPPPASPARRARPHPTVTLQVSNGETTGNSDENSSRTPTPTRSPRSPSSPRRHHHHRHHSRRRNNLDDPPPPYENFEFSCTPDYLSTESNPYCDPPAYPGIINITITSETSKSPK